MSVEQSQRPATGEDGEQAGKLPVLAQEATVLQEYRFAREVSRERAAGPLPAVQAAAVAAGGFVAGAAVVGLVARRQRHTPALTKGRGAGRALKRSGGRRRRGGSSGAGELVQIVGSRSLLVDVHLLGGRD